MLDKTEWFTTDRVILQQYSGSITLEDLHAGRNAIMDLLKDAPAIEKVHIIIDISRHTSFAPEIMQLRNMHRIFSYGDSSSPVGYLLVVQANPNPVLRFIAIASAKISGFRLRMISSIEDAHTFLKRADTSLPDSFISV